MDKFDYFIKRLEEKMGEDPYSIHRNITLSDLYTIAKEAREEFSFSVGVASPEDKQHLKIF